MDMPPVLPPPLPRKSGALGAVALLFAAGAVLAAGALFSFPEERLGLRLGLLIAAIFCGVVGVVLSIVGMTKGSGSPALTAAALVLNAGALITAGYFGEKISEQVAVELPAIIRGATAQDHSDETDGLEVASQPIVQSPGAMTFSDVEPIYQRWGEEKLLAAYESAGSRDPRWDDTARQYIRGWYYWRYSGGTKKGSEMPEWRRQLLEAGCRDPLVLYIAAQIYPQTEEHISLLTQAESAAAASGYSPALLFLIRSELFRARWNLKQRDIARAGVPACAETLRAALLERPLTADDHFVWSYLLASHASGFLLEQAGETICDTVDGVEGLEPWLKHQIRGRHEKELAWQARGKGWANEVKPDGWRGFEEHLALAREHLTKSWELNPNHPAAAATMIAVAMGSSQDAPTEMRLWFDRAITARFDAIQAYDSFMWGLRSRWHGSPAAMLALGQQCLATERFDTDVPWQLVEANRDIASEWDEPDAYYPERAPYGDLKRMFEGYLAAPAQAEHQTQYRSHYAVVAAKCGDETTARAQLEAVGFTLDPGVAQEWKVDPKEFIRRYGKKETPIEKEAPAAH
ncbi:MAG TPA: hypothetical protein VF614_10730 [Chthoniobacteraceae bacterium]|jgi:hypothetical protein